MADESDDPSELRTRLETGGWVDRLAAMQELLAAGPLAAAFYPQLVALLAAPDPEHRLAVVRTVADFDRPIVPALLDALRTAAPDDEDFRRAAVFAVRAIGPAAADAVPLLEALTADDRIGADAARALEAVRRRRPGRWLIAVAVGAGAAAVALAAGGPAPLPAPDPLTAVLVVVAGCGVVGLIAVRDHSKVMTTVAVGCLAAGVGYVAVGTFGGIFGKVAAVLRPANPR